VAGVQLWMLVQRIEHALQSVGNPTGG
jgi:hypothetical protein